MDNTLLMVFTGILAVVVVIQTILFFGMYRAIRHMSVAVDGMGKDLLGYIQVVSAKVDEGVRAIKDIAEGLKPIRDKLEDTTDIIRNRVTELDGFLAEIANTARLEILRIQDIDAISLGEGGRDTGVICVKAFLPPSMKSMRSAEPSESQWTFFSGVEEIPVLLQDEEMFI